MRIKAITDLEKFLDVIDECEGKVALVTEEGDHFNLKSKLSQYAAVTKVLSGEDDLDVQLIVSDPEEEKRLKAFLISD